jgi:hypothetical protein
VRSSVRQRRPDEPRAAVPERSPAAVDRVLELQQSAGNAAVARHIRTLAREGWPEAKGWNKQARPVTGTLRIPLTGLTQGYQAADTGKGTPTTEKAGEAKSGRAIVVVPDGTDFTHGKLEVLLLFHGLGQSAGIGYRERSSDDEMGPKGSVHDVEADVIPQQLAASGRNMISILAQGKSTGTSRFGIADTAAYVKDVLGKLKTELATLQPTVAVPDNLTPYRIVSAGHSGGGPQAVDSAVALQGGDWHRAAPLFLFDGINGPIELGTLKRTLQGWLETDRDHLLKAADPAAELAKRGLKFRSTYTTGAYLGNHEGGEYDLSGGKHVKISPAESLNAFLKDWFDANATGPLAPVKKAWKDQYVTEKLAGNHHYQIGVGGPKKTYDKGSGNLEKSLKGLPADAARPEKHAELEPEDDPSKVFA